MSTTLICSGCKVRLVIRDRVRTEYITCPRCLVAVKNPQAAPAAVAPVVTPDPRAAAPGTAVCTVCAEPLPGHAANCPASPAQREARPWSAPSADREASGDNHGTFVLAVLLAAMVVAGVSSILGSAAAMGLGFLLMLSILAGGKERALRNVANVLFALVVLGVILFVLALLAFLILCGGGGRRGW